MKLNVFRGQYGWQTIASSEYKGEEHKCYIPVYFKLQAEPTEDKAYIQVLEGRLGSYESRKMNADLPSIVVFKWEYAKKKEEEQKPDTSGLNWY